MLGEESCQNGKKIREMRPEVQMATYAPWRGQGAAPSGGGQGVLAP